MLGPRQGISAKRGVSRRGVKSISASEDGVAISGNVCTIPRQAPIYAEPMVNPRIQIPDGKAPLQQADDLAPALRNSLKEMRRLTLDATSLSVEEIEVIRVRSAELNGCRTCLSYRTGRDDPQRAGASAQRMDDDFYAAITGEGAPGALTDRGDDRQRADDPMGAGPLRSRRRRGLLAIRQAALRRRRIGGIGSDHRILQHVGPLQPRPRAG